MAWVKMVNEREADGALAESYREMFSRNPHWQEIPEMIKVFSTRPEVYHARLSFANAMTFGGSGLGRYREELIATSISAVLGCKF